LKKVTLKAISFVRGSTSITDACDIGLKIWYKDIKPATIPDLRGNRPDRPSYNSVCPLPVTGDIPNFASLNNTNHGNKTKKIPYPTLGYEKRR
jgi:hypothetical protein